MKNIVVLISGSGSNLQAIIDAVEKREIEGQIKAVISNKSDAFGLTRAANHNIEARTLSHLEFENRAAFDHALMDIIDEYQPDIVVLAGFMRILTDEFVSHYLGRLINIHPSLLPKYKGLHTHQRAIEAGDKEHGASVHFVTPELDDGPVIIQCAVPIIAGETVASLQEKVHVVEHLIYPKAVKLLCENRVSMTPAGVTLDDKRLPQSGIVHNV